MKIFILFLLVSNIIIKLDMKKIRPNHRYTYIAFLILFVAIEFLLWGIMGTKPWMHKDVGSYFGTKYFYTDLIYTLINISILVTIFIIYYVKVYYTIYDNYFVRNGRKIEEFYFKDIIYVDKEYSEKHIDMKIFTNTERWFLLTNDRKKELYKLILERSPLLSKDNLNYKYPNALRKEL